MFSGGLEQAEVVTMTMTMAITPAMMLMTLAWSLWTRAARAVSECRSVPLALSPASTAHPKAVPPHTPAPLSPSSAAIHSSCRPRYQNEHCS
ncbi:unnamed protein product, partial [Iphiclides podalirius]